MKNSTGKFGVWALIGFGAVLSGCSSIANFYDRADACQTRPELGRPANYEPPSYCGAGQGKTYIYDRRGQVIGYMR